MTLPSHLSTLPPSVPELDPESDDEHELSRISVLIGGLLIDVGVPSRVSISMIITDVIELANDQFRDCAGVAGKFDNPEGKWTFAHPTGDPIDPGRTLAAADVCDGDLLVIQEVGAPASSPLVDKLDGLADFDDNIRCRLSEQLWVAGWSVAGIALSAAAALLLRGRVLAPSVAGVPIAAMIVLLVGFGCAVATFVMPLRSGDPGRYTWLAAVALPLIFAGSLHMVPGAPAVKALPVALALTALIALLQLLSSGRGRPLYTTVIGLAVFGVPAAVAHLLLNLNPRIVGAMSATIAVIVVYLAPRATILLSRLPVPRVPTAGEPLDNIETNGGTTVEGVNAIGKQVIPTEEGMTDQVRRARDQLTGIVAAAATFAVVGSYLALDVGNGFFWQGTAFAVAVATVLCLRGRSHHDLIQSAVLIGGGLLTALAAIVKTATFVAAWQVNTAVALVALTALLVVCGLVAPSLEFSPVMRRRVEILESVAIGTVFPLACSIIRLYPFFREMRL
ncbi:type VII secretion integral membrane protein EccD [Mycobacterium sp. Dal123C01]|uniref:type VII secretion integral membrane protein EccD n=1 Tax=Mycobacterium sp. Dal123C01 TaxID=3457577 RepID=UPI00403E80DA